MDAPESYALLRWIPLIPLIGAAINGFFGKHIQHRFGEKVNGIIGSACAIIPFGIALSGFITLTGMNPENRALLDHVWTMATVGELQLDFAFYMDSLSAIMTLVVTGVGSLIHIYSIGYMHDDPSFWRFFSHLNLFLFSMLLLVLGDNLMLMFFGWEGVGLCSYLLIGFWYSDPEQGKYNAKCGMKAFVVNRIGDFAFLTGFFLLFWGFAGGWTEGGKYSAGRHMPSGVKAGYLDVASYQSKVDELKRKAKKSAHGNPAGHAANKAGHGDGHKVAAAGIHSGHKTGKPAHLAAQAHGALKVKHDVKAKKSVKKPFDFDTPAFTITIRKLSQREAHLAALKDKTVFGIPLAFLICLCLFIGACGKSAQIPLFIWLPDAMAGPTPVSALIHAATMVTAGVYMVARLNFLFSLSMGAMTIVATVGALTAIVAATMGFFQRDIKKVLAYSTISQLGYMFIGVGVGAYASGVFHLMTHAFFKACLFLGAGSVILGMHHRQDMFKMGGLKKYMKATWLTMLIATITIAGIPPFSGFFSKDEILWKAFSSANLYPGWGVICWIAGLLAAGCTAFYMFRLYYMTFTGENASMEPAGEGHHSGGDAHGHHALTEINESPKTITAVLWTLAILAMLAGALGLPHWLGPNVFEHWLEPVFATSAYRINFHHYGTGLELGLTAVSIVVALGGWLTARHFYGNRKMEKAAALAAKYPNLHRWIYNKYYWDEAYEKGVLKPTLKLTRMLSWFDGKVIDGLVNSVGFLTRVFAKIDSAIDKYVVDGLVDIIAKSVIGMGKKLRKMQTGRVQNYVYVAFGSVMIILLVLFFIG